MKKIVYLPILISSILLLAACYKTHSNKSQLVNPIIGDQSFEAAFGYKPDKHTDNQLRIKTHLAYVENLLRKKDVSYLSVEMQEKRFHALDLLHNYWTNAIFPKNYDFSYQRKPCFIDKDETICAVGYLIEQTTSRKVAEGINSKHKYSDLLEMNDATVDKWILQSGLTKQECAMIQPTYGPEPVYTLNNINPRYGISSSILGGINLSMNVVNGMQLGSGKSSKALPVISLITGIGQIGLGAACYPKEEIYWQQPLVNESQRNLSLINIGLGTATTMLSTWNLLTPKKLKNKSTAWNVFSYPISKNQTAMVISMKRRI
jgi:hypothetical protein